jgi:membrane protein implicated in regulation of membrane protease activity
VSGPVDRRPNRRPVWLRRAEAKVRRLDTGEAKRWYAWTGAALVLAGIGVQVVGVPWIGQVVCVAGMLLCTRYLFLRYVHLHPDAHIYPDAYLHPDLPEHVLYQVHRAGNGTYRLLVEGDRWDVTLTDDGWRVTAGPYLDLLANLAGEVPAHSTLGAAVITIRSVYADPE